MRYQYIDILRGLCILLMVLFHLNYSLVHIFGLDILNFSEIFWYILGKFSALWFMSIAGISYFLASQKYSTQELQAKYLKYAGVLGIIALGITLWTYVFIPQQLIVFGILHFFAFSFFLLPYITRTYLRTSLSLLVIVLISVISEKQVENEYLFPFWFYSESFISADYYPLFPYILWILWWYIFAATLKKYDILIYFHLRRNLVSPEKILSHIWKNSLVIYLIHQPIIIFFIWLIHRLA